MKHPGLNTAAPQIFPSITASGFGLKGEILLCRIRVTSFLCVPVCSPSFIHVPVHSPSPYVFRITFRDLFHITYLGSGRDELNHQTELSTRPDYVLPFYCLYLRIISVHLRIISVNPCPYCLPSYFSVR